MVMNVTAIYVDVDVFSWSFYLAIASVTILTAGCLLTSVTLMGTVKAALAKKATLHEWVVALFCFGLFQLCYVGQVGTLVRIVSHFRDGINVHISCLLNHFSIAFAASVLHTGLTASIIIHYIFAVYPRTAEKINQRPKLYKLIVTLLLTAAALARCFADYFHNKVSSYSYCVIVHELPYKDVISTNNLYYTLTFFLVVVTFDLIVTARTWCANNMKIEQVRTAGNATRDQGPKKIPLLTMNGAIYCRIVGTLAYFFFLFVRRYIPEKASPLENHFISIVGQLILYVFLTIVLPITLMVNSPFIKKWLRKKENPRILVEAPNANGIDDSSV